MFTHYYTQKKNTEGFTLLELLVVIAIIAILATILVIVINPVETLRRARDAQRLSDLSTMKTSVSLYMIQSEAVSEYGLDGQGNATCRNVATGVWPSAGSIYYSYAAADGSISDTSLDSQTLDAVTSDTPADIAGDGWIPIDFGSLAGSSPISNLPVDPINDFVSGSVNGLATDDLFYRYACGTNPISFEINARLESQMYTVDDNLMNTDGGNHDGLYESGTSLRILEDGVF